MSAVEAAVNVEQERNLMFSAQRIAGPETAALLGVPVGAVVETRDVRSYSNPERQAEWEAANPGGGSVWAVGKDVV